MGASIDFQLIAGQPLLIAGLVLALIVTKLVILAVIGRVGKMSLDQNSLFALALAQGGEFGFVLFSFATQNGILSDETAKPLVAVVALSMALTPLLFIIHERLIQPRFGTKEAEDAEPDAMDEDAPIIIAGFGRFGNVAGRFLQASGIETTVLEHDSDHVDLLRKLGLKVFYGDASRHDLMHAAGAEKAKLLVLAVDDEDKSMEIVECCQKHFPNLRILARACSRAHAYRLISAGVEDLFLEQQSSSLDLAVAALQRLGHRGHAARRAAAKFKAHDNESIREMAAVVTDRKTLIDHGRRRIADLENRMKRDRVELCEFDDKAWDDQTLRDGF